MEFKDKSGIETQKEAQKSIIDMDPILKRIPPIESVFSPNKEVEKLWSVPKTERRKAVALFRDKLARQGEAWMLCRTSIEKRIEANPDLSRDEMIGTINEFASYYGFAKKDIKIAELLIDDYMEMRKRVVEIRKKFPDDIALINRLTGLKFTKADAKDFKVSVGPMSIKILCSGFNAGRIYEKSESSVGEFKYGGFAAQSSDENPICYLVINNDYAIKNPDYYASVVPHEQKHLKSEILSPRLYKIKEVRDDVREKLNKSFFGSLKSQDYEESLGFERNLEDELFLTYESTKNPKKKTFLLTEYMRLKREYALNRVKDEIFAMKAEHPYKRSNYNIFLRQDSDSYDYLASLRDWERKRYDDLWQKTSQRVLVEEYRKIIENAIDAFDDLRSNNYSPEEAIAILSDKRLPEWPKTVRRLLEQKKKDK